MKIAEKIIDNYGYYMVRLKGNHGTLNEVGKLVRDDAIANGDYDYAHTTDGGHGRVEIRKVWYCQDGRVDTRLQRLARFIEPGCRRISKNDRR